MGVNDKDTADWIAVGTLYDIPLLGSRIVRLPYTDIALFRAEGDRVFAVEDKCPHKEGPLSQGIVHGRQVTCPLHNWVIELETGEAVAPDVGCVKTYDVRLSGADLYLRVAIGGAANDKAETVGA
jgi:nitrite reductase (NADH) small subunit